VNASVGSTLLLIRPLPCLAHIIISKTIAKAFSCKLGLLFNADRGYAVGNRSKDVMPLPVLIWYEHPQGENADVKNNACPEVPIHRCKTLGYI